MKNIINQSVLIALLLFLAFRSLSQPPANEERNVFWLHGFQGDVTSWEIYEPIFTQERMMDGLRIEYNSNTGVIDASDQVRNDVNNLPINESTEQWNIALGHSMGGVVSREFERQNYADATTGGIITVGAPNHGAFISNSFLDGQVDQFINNACEELTAGPLNNFPIIIHVLIQAVSDDQLCNLLFDEVVEPELENLNNQSAIDLANASDYFQNTLDPHNPNVPIVSVHGIERSPVHWRLASSFETDAMDEEKYVEIAKKMQRFYLVQEAKNAAKGTVSGIVGFLNPAAWLLAGKYAFNATQWHRGARWLNESEDHWHVLIGAHRWDTETFQVEQMTASCEDQLNDLLLKKWNEGPGSGINITDPSDIMEDIRELLEDPNCYELVDATRDVFVKESSDGFIPTSSQIFNGSTDEYEAEGVNHREELNTTAQQTLNGNDEMEDTFNDIWNDIGFFNTDPR